MSIQQTVISIVLVAAWSAGANAQTDFFWSFNDFHTGATNSDASGQFQIGDQGRLFLYYSTMTSELDTGAGLDLSLTNNDVIEFTAARTYDFGIDIGGTPIGNRWLDSSTIGGGFAGDAQNVTADSITGLNAFTVVGGFGIADIAGSIGPFVDSGYDSGADAFLFGSVDFTVTGFGSTDINTVVGSIGIVHEGQSLNPTFGNATIRVVPEPSSTCLMLVLLGFMTARRR